MNVNAYAEPLHFFLVERRRNGATDCRAVFRSAHDSVKRFGDWLNDMRYFRFGALAGHFANTEELSKTVENGVGYSEVTPVVSVAINCQLREFRQEIAYKCEDLDDLAGRRVLFVTQDPHPASSAALDVEEVREEKVTRWEKFVRDLREGLARELGSGAA
jgi:hypothetical protein